MTFEDDKREKYRKDLIKALPIDVKEDSEDERWGFPTNNQKSNRIFSTDIKFLLEIAVKLSDILGGRKLKHTLVKILL
jgi:hypothetical protein